MPKTNLICGNSLEILPTFKNKEFDYFITSVPFKENEFGNEKYWENMNFIISELRRITSKAGFMFQSSTKMQEMYRRYPDIKRVLIWGKLPSMYAFRYEPIFVWQFGDFKVNKYLFKDLWVMPAILGNSNTYENPVKLYYEIMLKLPKGHVLDCFSGTGTTMKACRKLGMDFTGIDIEKNKPCFDKGLIPYMGD